MRKIPSTPILYHQMPGIFPQPQSQTLPQQLLMATPSYRDAQKRFLSSIGNDVLSRMTIYDIEQGTVLMMHLQSPGHLAADIFKANQPPAAQPGFGRKMLNIVLQFIKHKI